MVGCWLTSWGNIQVFFGKRPWPSWPATECHPQNELLWRRRGWSHHSWRKKNEPMLGSTVFFHMKERGSQQRKMWNFLTLVEKKQKSDWCKQWIAAEAAERPQTNQLPKYYPDPFNLQTSSIRISHSQNTEFGDITPNTGVSFSNVSMVSWSFELEVEHWEDFLYIYIYI